jgi:hypothetical protein
MSAVIDKIKKRGYWTVRIHPDRYPTLQRRTLAELEQAVRQSEVSVRGWNFPQTTGRSDVKRSQDYIEYALDWEHYIELWRAYKSGQFVSVSGIWNDWQDQSRLWPAPSGWRAGTTLLVEGVVFRFVEIYEFAARWAQALALKGSLSISSAIKGLQDRQIVFSPGRTPFFTPQACTVPEWAHSESYDLTMLRGQPRELAISPTISLFELFGWDAGPGRIRDIQGQLRR